MKLTDKLIAFELGYKSKIDKFGNEVWKACGIEYVGFCIPFTT